MVEMDRTSTELQNIFHAKEEDRIVGKTTQTEGENIDSNKKLSTEQKSKNFS